MNEISPRQKKVLDALRAAGGPVTIKQLGHRAFPGVRPATKAQSWVRNQLRGLVANKQAKRVDDGTYEARS